MYFAVLLCFGDNILDDQIFLDNISANLDEADSSQDNCSNRIKRKEGAAIFVESTLGTHTRTHFEQRIMRSPLNRHSQTARMSARPAPDLLEGQGQVVLRRPYLRLLDNRITTFTNRIPKDTENEVRAVRTAVIIAVSRRMCHRLDRASLRIWAGTYRQIAKTMRSPAIKKSSALHLTLVAHLCSPLCAAPWFRQRSSLFGNGAHRYSPSYRGGGHYSALARGRWRLRCFSLLSFDPLQTTPALYPTLCRSPQRSPSWHLRGASSRAGCFATSSTAATIASLETPARFIMEHHLYRTEAGCGVPDTHTDARLVRRLHAGSGTFGAIAVLIVRALP